MRFLALVALTTFAWSGLAMAQEASADSLAVADAAIATSVVDREPQGSAESFAADVGQVHCWTRIVNAGDSTTVEHVWYHGEQELARIPLVARGPSWRTWSTKTVPPDRTGEWRVDIVGPGGTVLRSLRFTVQ